MAVTARQMEIQELLNDRLVDLLSRQLALWAAAGFMDTLLRCEDETGGGLWEREGNSVGSSKLKQSSWLRSAV
jgi:hypothetical protein